MTIKPGDYALWLGSYRPVVVSITAVTDKTVRLKEGEYRERRGDKASIAAYGPDPKPLERAAAQMISATAEAHRRRAAAGVWEREQHARIAKELMA